LKIELTPLVTRYRQLLMLNLASDLTGVET